MNYFALILPKLVSFLILLSVGYFVAWRGILRREGMASIAALLIRVVLPCLSADLLIEQGIDAAALADYAVPVLWMLAAYAVMTAVGAAGARLAGLKGLLKNVHIGCSIGGNYAFVVLPLAMALFTAQEQSIIQIGSAVDTTMVWTLGLGIFTRGLERESLRGRIKRFFTPVLLSIILALTLNAETAPAGVCAHAGALHRAGQLQSGLHIRGRVAVLHAEAAARVRKAAGAAGGGAAGDSAAGGISHLAALCAGVSEHISDARRGRAGDEHLLHHLPPVRAG